ncbi:MAG: DUF2752 domain-containing protein [Flavisolibacter sp.]
MATIKQYLPSFIWTIALASLFFMNAAAGDFSFCVFRIAGFESCFGCGIGHAIHHALHLNFPASMEEHPLGIPASIALIFLVIKPLLPPKKIQQV